ncbi:hypothetical protein GcM1_160013, partial [Golovinomyces cichoracearum]
MFEGEIIIPSASAQKPASIQPSALAHESEKETVPTVPTIPPIIKPPLVNKNLIIPAPQDIPIVPNNVWPNNSVNKEKDIIPSNSSATQQQIQNESQTLKSSSSVVSDYDSFSDEENELEEIDEQETSPNESDSQESK